MDKKDQWFKDRWGLFTASEAYKLLSPSKNGGMFGEGAITYIEQKAMEMSTEMWERPNLEEVKSLLYGKVYEYPAYDAFINQTKNYSMAYCGTEEPMFLEYEKMKGEAGGSPDIVNITKSNTVDAGAEIKCPINPLFHFRRLVWKDQWDIKQNYILCYTQMQMLMMITDAPLWFFISYDERQRSKANKCKIIEVKPDRKFQNNLEVRLHCAVKEKHLIYNRHMGLA